MDASVFRAYEKALASDRTREEANFVIDERLHCLERTLQTFITKEEHAEELLDKAPLFKIDEMRELLDHQKSINLAEHEKLLKRLDTMK